MDLGCPPLPQARVLSFGDNIAIYNRMKWMWMETLEIVIVKDIGSCDT